MDSKNFLTSKGRRPNTVIKEESPKCPGNGKGWGQGMVVKTLRHVKMRGRGEKEKTEALKGHRENSYFCALSRREGLPSQS